MLAFLLLVVVLLVVVEGVMVRPLFWPNASVNVDATQKSGLFTANSLMN